MRRTKLIPLLVATGALGAGAAALDRAAKETPRLTDLQRLVGEWVEVGEDGKPTDVVVSTYRMTSGGSALLQTVFPGSDHEMLTVYYEDGDDLVLTHYCVLANQPHMRALPPGDGGELVFECVAGGELDAEGQKHMHEGHFRWIGEDELETEWIMVEKGEVVYTARHRQVRRTQ